MAQNISVRCWFTRPRIYLFTFNTFLHSLRNFSLETRFSWIWMDWIHDFNLRSSFWKCHFASPILLRLAEGDTRYGSHFRILFAKTIASFTLSPIYGTKNWLKSEC